MSDQSRKKSTFFRKEVLFLLTSSFNYDIIPLSNKGKSSKAVSNPPVKRR